MLLATVEATVSSARRSNANLHEMRENVLISYELKSFNGIRDESHHGSTDTRGKGLGALEC
jgi:hypothetical protein